MTTTISTIAAAWVMAQTMDTNSIEKNCAIRLIDEQAT